MNPIVIAAFSMIKLLLQQSAATSSGTAATGAAAPAGAATGAAAPDVSCPPSTGLSKCDMCDPISGSSCLCGRLAVVKMLYRPSRTLLDDPLETICKYWEKKQYFSTAATPADLAVCRQRCIATAIVMRNPHPDVFTEEEPQVLAKLDPVGTRIPQAVQECCLIFSTPIFIDPPAPAPGAAPAGSAPAAAATSFLQLKSHDGQHQLSEGWGNFLEPTDLHKWVPPGWIRRGDNKDQRGHPTSHQQTLMP